MPVAMDVADCPAAGSAGAAEVGVEAGDPGGATALVCTESRYACFACGVGHTQPVPLCHAMPGCGGLPWPEVDDVTGRPN